MKHNALVVYSCFGLQLLTFIVVIYCESLAPMDKRMEGKSLKRLKQAMYVIQLVTWLIILISW